MLCEQSEVSTGAVDSEMHDLCVCVRNWMYLVSAWLLDSSPQKWSSELEVWNRPSSPHYGF